MNDFICWILQNVKYYTFKLFIVVMMIDQLVQTKTLILRRISIFSISLLAWLEMRKPLTKGNIGAIVFHH